MVENIRVPIYESVVCMHPGNIHEGIGVGVFRGEDRKKGWGKTCLYAERLKWLLVFPLKKGQEHESCDKKH